MTAAGQEIMDDYRTQTISLAQYGDGITSETSSSSRRTALPDCGKKYRMHRQLRRTRPSLEDVSLCPPPNSSNTNDRTYERVRPARWHIFFPRVPRNKGAPSWVEVVQRTTSSPIGIILRRRDTTEGRTKFENTFISRAPRRRSIVQRSPDSEIRCRLGTTVSSAKATTEV